MIDGDMYVEDIVSNYPDAVKFLMERDVICIKCGAPVWGTLNELLAEQNIENPDSFIREMNDHILHKDD